MQENLESVVEFLLRPRQRGLSLLDHWLRPTPAKMAPFITGADTSGHYSVYLGLATSDGLPATLFTSGKAHWLGIRIAGQAEQPRVFLVSVPYAMKAGDAP